MQGWGKSARQVQVQGRGAEGGCRDGEGQVYVGMGKKCQVCVDGLWC